MRVGALSELHLAATYVRDVKASTTRIWENVFDWEHLAHLHDGSFAQCELLGRGAAGWRVRLTPVGGRPQVIELTADQAAGRYVSTTLEGTGLGTEIHVLLTPQAAHATGVTVEFHLPEPNPTRRDAIGQAYAAVYARLWDEDEAMMQVRERMLARRRRPEAEAAPVDLGPEPAVLAQLPLAFEWGGAPYRLIELDGTLLAHSTVCPHWLGPLGDAAVADGAVRCPWHGYRFDVATGACLTHRSPSLARAPVVTVEAGRVIARAKRTWG